jgi:hypothetical protein
MHIYAFICIYLHVYIHIYINICMYVYMHMFISTYIYIYIYITLTLSSRILILLGIPVISFFKKFLNNDIEADSVDVLNNPEWLQSLKDIEGK